MSVTRAINTEIRKRERRLKVIEDKARPLLAEHKALKEQIEALQALAVDAQQIDGDEQPQVADQGGDAGSVNERIERIVAALRQHGEMSPRELCTVLDLSGPQIKRPLMTAVECKLIVARGETRSRRYAIPTETELEKAA